MPNFTEQAIKQAFAQLIKERPLPKIKVKDIVERCGINRNSFYYHYADLPALVDSIISDVVDRLTSDHSAFSSFDDAFVCIVRFITANKASVYHIYSFVDHTVSERYLMSMCNKTVSAVFDRVYGGHKITDRDRKIIVRHFKEEFFGMLFNWLESGMKYDILAYFNRLCELRQGETQRIIENADKKI
ncbi:MAG: TetR/AcrR family transcriptional regulator C-terminal domain-containing protein [Clostridia bacterium]|nr:TetR/AcrR family transcriptional regulator C-terminal domain-containing protein [Clostridia bacterium]